ncbi:hypothetical protein GCM10027516_09240 [Niabella aquatica]
MKATTHTNTHVSKGDRLNWVRRCNAGSVKLDASKTKGTLVSGKQTGNNTTTKKVIA